MKNQQTKIKEWCEAALFAAFVFLGTYLFRFPGLYGYTHLGDSMIFLAVLMLGRCRGSVAGGVGAGLADLLSGYSIWILPTVLWKTLMAFTMGTMIEKRALGLRGKPLCITAAACGALLQGLGYVSTWYFLFGPAAALSAIPGLAFQAMSGILIAFAASAALLKTPLRSRLMFPADKDSR